MDANQRYLKELENRNSTQEKTLELILKARKGDEKARTELIENYLLHVYKIAREYMNKGVPLEDLVQEGNMGLLTALDKYNTENGAPFGVYSRFWIKQSIIRNCMHKRRVVRLPENISELMRTDRWKGSQDYKEFSIDMPYEDGGSFSDKLPSHDNLSFLEKEEAQIVNKKIESILSFLKKRDAEIVRAHFGIGIEKPMEIEEIAELFSLGTTRINQILRNSLKIMRKSQSKSFQKNSLQIISATYGIDEASIDVTDIISEMVENNEHIKCCNKLAGDPCKGVAKFLYIQYSLDGKMMTKKVKEGFYVNF